MSQISTKKIQTLLQDVKENIRASCDFERVKETMSNGHPKNVIVCDDDAHDRKAIIDIISKCDENYLIIEAEDGDECLKIIEDSKDPIVALFIDLRMPKVDGYEVLNKIRDRGFLKVVVTGSEIIDRDRELLKGVCDRWIKKPNGITDNFCLNLI